MVSTSELQRSCGPFRGKPSGRRFSRRWSSRVWYDPQTTSPLTKEVHWPPTHEERRSRTWHVAGLMPCTRILRSLTARGATPAPSCRPIGLDAHDRAPYVAPTHQAERARTVPGARPSMPSCVHCGQSDDVGLFDVRRSDGHIERQWWSLQCAWIHRRLGHDIAPSPRWIERAALQRLPPRDLLTPRPIAIERRSGTDRRVRTA